ncbi:MAG: hypothetical protein IIT56_13650 [Bacteroidales bacterium]|nr:hypothetical protein [Bacteroidales bacterium]
MTARVCPYPGLRPFTEEESIFFKGRDLHIRQIVKLLEENKMAFITGASGDGKSSMVYAGVVPYIRAGFFKAQFNNWIIADFKPQKNPLESLSNAFAEQIECDESVCMNQLKEGFSALTDLYKSSKCYTKDSNSGKNLLIIADQFEEIFTNIENFNQGRPSDESYTAINLLLETIRISITEKLPVYVIFTMRSDFISQCTVFKNLPEYIAYSQFFVPQLKRTEIRQVIEEPAILAGGKVSSRLTEVIINNLNSGFDQLPVLQHALNLLWRIANNGEDVMDLIHLAKIAGISSEVLSPDDKGEFDRWFNNLPEYQKKYYEKTDLNNVLNAHAGILYESAYDYFIENSDWAEKNISVGESKEIIEIVFKSLTKVDNNRPVRNRCTLSEITGIINRENVTNATVCGVINIFRTPDNSLIKPFLDPEKTETQYLSGDTVLDVTHEALIRNWKMLSEWDTQEAADMKDYQDFNSQMQLWIKSEKNPSYLLNSGNYTYFNQWFNRSNPNPYLFVKYDSSKLPARQKLKNAQFRYENYIDFLESSFVAIQAKAKAAKRRVRFILYGMLIFIATLGVFTSWALKEKDNAQKQTVEAERQKQYALDQQAIAVEQQKAAERANKIASQQRDTAELRAFQALEAQKRAEYASYIAEKNRRTAVEERLRADSNYQKMLEQKLISDALGDSLKGKIEENDRVQREKDEINNLAKANMLAMKAKNQYKDKKMNLNLILTADSYYNLNDQSENTPEFYDAVLFALEENNLLQPLKTTSQKIMGFAIDEDNQIICLTEKGQIIGYKLDKEKTKETKISKGEDSRFSVRKACFADAENLVYSTSDKNTYYVNTKTGEKVKLASQGDYIKAASVSTDKKLLVLAYEMGKVVVLNYTDPDSHVIKSINLKTKLSDVNCALNNSEVYILTDKGSLIKWNIKNGSQKTVFSQSGSKATNMVTIPNKRQLAICFDNGEIQVVDTKSDTQAEKIAGSYSGLQNVVYNIHSGLLAVSGVDNRITIINTRDDAAKRLVIEQHSLNRQPVVCMGYASDDILYVLTADNALRYFYMDIQKYMQKVKSADGIMFLNDQKLKVFLGEEF